MLAFRQGDYAQAVQRSSESLAARRALEDTHGIASTLNTLGIVAIDQSDFERAVPLLEESLALQQALGEKRGMAVALDNLAQIAHHRGALDRAAELLDARVRLNRELGAMATLATSLCNLVKTFVSFTPWSGALWRRWRPRSATAAIWRATSGTTGGPRISTARA